MIDTHSNITIAYIGRKDLVPGLRAFLEEYRVVLENFAGFLGGPPWTQRAIQFRGNVADDALPPRACLREVWAFLALLRAGIDQDARLGASRRCVRLGPSDPRAQDIQQLHDRLQSLAEALSCGDHAAYHLPA